MTKNETDSVLAEKYRKMLVNNNASARASRERLKASGKHLLQVWVTSEQDRSIRNILDNKVANV